MWLTFAKVALSYMGKNYMIFVILAVVVALFGAGAYWGTTSTSNGYEAKISKMEELQAKKDLAYSNAIIAEQKRLIAERDKIAADMAKYKSKLSKETAEFKAFREKTEAKYNETVEELYDHVKNTTPSDCRLDDDSLRIVQDAFRQAADNQN